MVPGTGISYIIHINTAVPTMSNNTFRNIICDTIFLEAGHPALFRSSGHLIENSKA